MSKKSVRKLTRKDNPELSMLIKKLIITNRPIWKKTAEELLKSRRNRVEVNINKLENYANNGDVILVPGKVLGTGNISKKITVAAFSFSNSAKTFIETAGGKTITIDQLYNDNKDGKNVILMV